MAKRRSRQILLEKLGPHYHTPFITKAKMGKQRSRIKAGLKVAIVQKQHQRSGTLTAGIVKDILTNAPSHPHGVKVRLESGEVGRVKNIDGEDSSDSHQQRF